MNEQYLHKLIPQWLIHSELFSVVVTDMNGNYTFVNNFFKKKFGFLRNDFIGISSLETIHEDDRLKCLNAAHECLANPHMPVKILLRKSNISINDFLWTEWEFSPFRDENQNIIGIICIGHDISDTEKAIQQAANFAGKIEMLLEEIPDCYLEVDKSFIVLKTNKSTEKILGVSRDEIIGKGICEFVPEVQTHNYGYYIQQINKEKTGVWFDDYLPSINKWISFSVYDSIVGFSIFFKDISSQKEKEQKIVSQNEILKKVAWQQSHILRKPIANILGLCEILKTFYSNYSEEENTCLSYLYQSGSELDEVVKNIVSQIHDGKIFEDI